MLAAALKNRACRVLLPTITPQISESFKLRLLHSQQRHLRLASAAPQTMEFISYHNKTFTSLSNSDNGEVSSSTVFHYHQSHTDPKIVWAEYTGGSIAKGFLIATIQPDYTLDARYEHVNTSGKLMTGKCKSTPELLADGRLRLHEKWQWTSGDESSGSSIVEEVEIKD